MASIEVLYACTNCHQKFSLEELSSTQQLCKSCRKKYPPVQCQYCQLDFHQLDKSAHLCICEQCSKELKQYGPPSNCSICNLQSAFKGNKCIRCAHSEKKYGEPVTCEHCKLKCAFIKPLEAKKKVQGKTLCLICTMNYKKTLFRKKSSTHDKQSLPVTKKPRLDPTFPAYSFSTNKMEVPDPLSTELMQETEKLKTELSSMKKQMSLKDQQLLDKDKVICTLKAENLEREKDYKMKVQTLQKQNYEAVNDLKMEVQSLRKQLSQSTKARAKLPPASSS